MLVLTLDSSHDDRRSVISMALRRGSLVPFPMYSDTVVCARGTVGIEVTQS